MWHLLCSSFFFRLSCCNFSLLSSICRFRLSTLYWQDEKENTWMRDAWTFLQRKNNTATVPRNRKQNELNCYICSRLFAVTSNLLLSWLLHKQHSCCCCCGYSLVVNLLSPLAFTSHSSTDYIHPVDVALITCKCCCWANWEHCWEVSGPSKKGEQGASMAECGLGWRKCWATLRSMGWSPCMSDESLLLMITSTANRETQRMLNSS